MDLSISPASLYLKPGTHRFFPTWEEANNAASAQLPVPTQKPQELGRSQCLGVLLCSNCVQAQSQHTLSFHIWVPQWPRSMSPSEALAPLWWPAGLFIGHISLFCPIPKTALHRCCNTSPSMLFQGLAQLALQLAGCFCGASYPVCLTECQLQESRPAKKCLQQGHRDVIAARAGSRDTHDW